MSADAAPERDPTAEALKDVKITKKQRSEMTRFVASLAAPHRVNPAGLLTRLPPVLFEDVEKPPLEEEALNMLTRFCVGNPAGKTAMEEAVATISARESLSPDPVHPTPVPEERPRRAGAAEAIRILARRAGEEDAPPLPQAALQGPGAITHTTAAAEGATTKQRKTKLQSDKTPERGEEEDQEEEAEEDEEDEEDEEEQEERQDISKARLRFSQPNVLEDVRCWARALKTNSPSDLERELSKVSLSPIPTDTFTHTLNGIILEIVMELVCADSNVPLQSLVDFLARNLVFHKEGTMPAEEFWETLRAYRRSSRHKKALKAARLAKTKGHTSNFTSPRPKSGPQQNKPPGPRRQQGYRPRLPPQLWSALSPDQKEMYLQTKKN